MNRRWKDVVTSDVTNFDPISVKKLSTVQSSHVEGMTNSGGNDANNSGSDGDHYLQKITNRLVAIEHYQVLKASK